MSEKTVLDLMKTRRSVRKYKSDPVPDELIEKVIEAGLFAASGMSMQGAIVIAVTDKGLRDRLAKINAEIAGASQDMFYGAPVVLVVLSDKSVPTYLYDGSLVIGNMMLEAHELGLGSCWIHRAKQTFELPEGKAILKELGIEGDYEGIGNCILGYAENDEEKIIPRRENRVYYAK